MNRLADQPLEDWWPAYERRQRVVLWVLRIAAVVFLAAVLVLATTSQSEQEPSPVTPATSGPAVEYAP